jgi:predicted PurR-regulated permease PerM
MTFLSKKKYTFDRVVRIAIVIVIGWALYQLVDYLKDVLIPFAIAAVLAYLLHPVVSFIQHKLKVRNRFASVILTIALLIGFFTLVGIIIVPMISQEIRDMSRNITEITQKAQGEEQLPKKIKEFILNLVQQEEFQDVIHSQNFEEFAINSLKKVIPSLWKFFSGTVNVIFGIFGALIIFLYLIFLLVDFDSMIRDAKKIIPPDIKASTLNFFGDFRGAMGSYFRAVIIKSMILIVVFSVGFSVIGLPLGILAGIIAGLLNLIPYMQILAIFPTALLAIAHSLDTGESLWAMLGLVALVFVIAQIIEEVILNPKIMGKAMSLNPAEVLLSLSVWGKLLGFLGLIIALPFTYLLKLYYFRLMDKKQAEYEKEVRQARLEEKAIRGNKK